MIIYLETSPNSLEQSNDLQKEVLNLRYKGFLVWVIRQKVWLNKKKLIQILIQSRLQKQLAVFARDIHIKMVSEDVSYAFLEKYHLLGFTKSRFYLGIYIPTHRIHRYSSNGLPELIGVAIFGKNLIRKKEGFQGKKSLEWVRLATLPWIRIVGGISKIFNYMEDLEAFDDIMTYVDIESNDAKGLKGFGFHLEEISPPMMVEDEFNLGNYKLRYVKS
ncbi:MAG: hypothetical protein RJA76_234 [Bacteroidota bacterium]